MNVRCLNCGHEFKLQKIWHDDLVPDGFFTKCPECDGSFDLDDDTVNDIKKKMFIDDVYKMAHFFWMPRHLFIKYCNSTEDEYDATKMYTDWLSNTKADEEWYVSIDDDFAVPPKNDEAKFIFLWNPKIDMGAEYWYEFYKGKNVSAIYLKYDGDVDFDVYKKYIVDFNDPLWKRKLVDTMRAFVEARNDYYNSILERIYDKKEEE